MKIQILQTTDPFRYFELFRVTSTPTRRFCELNCIPYVGFVGIKVGCYPWHATYNRILLFSDLIQNGYDGWVLYLDADAYIASFDFDIRNFLTTHQHRSLLGAPGGEQHWNVNAGILMLNLGRITGKRIVTRWLEKFTTEIGEQRLRSAEAPWQAGIKDDQALLHEVLSTEDFDTEVERFSLDFIGHPASRFIRQLLRQYGSFEARLERARLDTTAIMAQAPLRRRAPVQLPIQDEEAEPAAWLS